MREPPKVEVRLIRPGDPISQITQLLHRAYRPQVEMGLRPLAGRQTDEVTAERAANSECFLAIVLDPVYAPAPAPGSTPAPAPAPGSTPAPAPGRSTSAPAPGAEFGAGSGMGTGAAGEGSAAGRIGGVILFEEQEKVDFPAFFLMPHVAHFAQFGVDPDLQGLGIGRMLLERVEQRAREKGATELALSMAEPDTNLRRFYDKRGFRFIEYWQWPYTNYRSCILAKELR